MITPDSIHALQGILALQTHQVPAVFVGTAVENDPNMFVVGYRTYILELSDTASYIRTVSRNEEEESLRRLYAEFEAEDRELADSGLGDYQRMLSQIEEPGE